MHFFFLVTVDGNSQSMCLLTRCRQQKPDLMRCLSPSRRHTVCPGDQSHLSASGSACLSCPQLQGEGHLVSERPQNLLTSLICRLCSEVISAYSSKAWVEEVPIPCAAAWSESTRQGHHAVLRLVLLISSSTMVNVPGLSLGHGNQHRAISSAKGLLFAQDQRQVPSGACACLYHSFPLSTFSFLAGPETLSKEKNILNKRKGTVAMLL